MIHRPQINRMILDQFFRVILRFAQKNFPQANLAFESFALLCILIMAKATC